MLKKGFLLNSKVVPKRLSKEEKGKGVVMSGACAQDKLLGSLHPDLFSVLDPLDMALIQDSLGAAFQFDWDAALEHIQSKVGLDDIKLPLSKGREQPGTSHTTVHTSVDVEPSGQSPSQDIRAEIGAGWDYGNVIREGSHSGLGCSKNSEVDMSGTSLNKGDKPTQKVKRPKRVHLGKDFLLIDRNSCQALQSGGSFQFFHRKSLSVVEVRIGGHSDPILPDAVVEIEMEAPSLDILPTSSQSCEETLQPSPPTSPTLLPSSPVLSDCDMEEQAPTTGKVSLSDTFMFCYAGGSKRIRASILRCPKSSKLIFAITDGKRKREPRIEDSYSDPSLFRPPRRRSFGLG
ncbi:hypothetical protein LOK49_LG03G00099 [Camellia lanceoleosa]|uniref:Uncharacterized protein n=1 Tax=Camellia lanceoleosa TaxID=1840588 RepID=A0ACC0I881_9ERIC|nr:hypothetical protein LOK49_LG03G00099 [Camellia lanceoleosa]